MLRAMPLIKRSCMPTLYVTHLLASDCAAIGGVRRRCDKTTSETSTSEQNRQRALKYLQKHVVKSSDSRVEIDEKETNQRTNTTAFPTAEDKQEEKADLDELGVGFSRREERRDNARTEAKKRVLKYIPCVTGDIPNVKTLSTMLEMEHGGHDVIAIDVSDKASFADWIIVVTGLSVSHVIAIADGLQKDMRAAGVRVGGNDVTLCGRDTGNWVAVDIGNVVVHVMTEEMREHYDIETLWTSELSEGKEEKEDGNDDDDDDDGSFIEENRNRDR